MKVKLSVVLATRNEEKNLPRCLSSVEDIADEIIVFDEHSTDKTREIAREFGAKVKKNKHKKNFHETKQAAIEAAKGDWVLQLDADEVVTPELAEEIVEVINSPNEKLIKRVLDKDGVNNQQLIINNQKKSNLFARHQQLIEEREGKLGKSNGNVVAFFIPRKNYFLGKPLIYAGVYPDAVIRLIKKGKAWLPAKSVHEVMEVDGEIGWLFNDLEHHESPTLKRYFQRADRYTDYSAKKLREGNVPKNILSLLKHFFLLPVTTFLSLYLRHKGFLDGYRGFLWSLFSALHHPITYWKYLTNKA